MKLSSNKFFDIVQKSNYFGRIFQQSSRNSCRESLEIFFIESKNAIERTKEMRYLPMRPTRLINLMSDNNFQTFDNFGFRYCADNCVNNLSAIENEKRRN